MADLPKKKHAHATSGVACFILLFVKNDSVSRVAASAMQVIPISFVTTSAVPAYDPKDATKPIVADVDHFTLGGFIEIGDDGICGNIVIVFLSI